MQVTVRVRNDVLAQLAAIAQCGPRQECCGLLAGRDGAITRVLRAANAAQEKTRSYEIAPEELFRLMREIRSEGLELMGIYHSHPNGNNEPSPRDIERAYYPDVAYFIVSPHSGAPQPVRAFAIRDGGATELRIESAEGSGPLDAP